MKISATMQAALDHAAAGDGKLYRWRGGFWTNHRMPVGWSYHSHGAPETSFGTGTIHALLNRGLVEIEARMARGDPWIVHPSPKEGSHE